LLALLWGSLAGECVPDHERQGRLAIDIAHAEGTTADRSIRSASALFSNEQLGAAGTSATLTARIPRFVEFLRIRERRMNR
uniref:Uncharacterized protein n=1 Tax=Plectus sambesii TaxID=2011161 RepID=A0A914VDV0_9BILA